MSLSNARKLFLFTFLIVSTVAVSFVRAQYNDHENPDLYPGAWFRILLGSDGKIVEGDGHGYNNGTWYYYPQTGWYRQWYYNEPFSESREGYLKYEVYIKAIDRSRLTYVEVNFNWTTPEWSKLGLNRPPLPGDASTPELEARYMASRRVYLVDGWYIGTIEPIYSHIIKEYNPEWVSIDVRGQNAYLFRGAMHKCRARPGACCNRETGECNITYEDECPSPLEWLGPDSSCAACIAEDGIPDITSGMDFGDAPNSYKTLVSSDGARHVKVYGVYLGRSCDIELDGRPDTTALGDDFQGSADEDGIVFTSPLLPGTSATLEATASTTGYINAWIDFNRDGDFADPDEQIFLDELIETGVNRLTFRIPATAAAGSTYARFRFNTRGLLSYYGLATDGEVEDYRITLARQFEPQTNSGKGGLKWSQPPQRFDATTPFIFNGWSERSDLNLHHVAADDWQHVEEQPITGIQWWGAFDGWTQPMLPSVLPLAFYITMWTDSGQGHPDTLVWEKFCTDWTWSLAGYHSDPRGLGDDSCFQFTCMLSQDQWFNPPLARDKNNTAIPAPYWLSIAVLYDTTSSTPVHPWGWTTRPQHSGQDAVQISAVAPSRSSVTNTWPPAVGSRWAAGSPIENPPGVAWDLAFELLTTQSSPASDPGLAPVYRFWSEKLGTHFYTIIEEEKDRLIRDFSQTWTFEGIVFYAYPPDQAPVGSKPVYHFWSEKNNRHFYTISETEKKNLLEQSSDVWKLEGVSWYAFD
ncbi:MAG TPA: GEVED domain-containing protein [Sedimentisphaerales bacterium]|nr:GEVED domain-containing protein [Sedimentisphaerales bacterium]